MYPGVLLVQQASFIYTRVPDYHHLTLFCSVAYYPSSFFFFFQLESSYSSFNTKLLFKISRVHPAHVVLSYLEQFEIQRYSGHMSQFSQSSFCLCLSNTYIYVCLAVEHIGLSCLYHRYSQASTYIDWGAFFFMIAIVP